MTEPKKSAAQKAPAEAKKATEPAQRVPENKTVAHHVSDKIFAKIQAKTGIDNKKVDEWQKKWLLLPEHRTKYEHLKNLPDVMGEEIFAMTNDIIDFIQKEEGGQSIVFKKMKGSFKDFMSNPIDYLRKKADEGKKKVMDAKEFFAKKPENKPADKTPVITPKETTTETTKADPAPVVAKKSATKPKTAIKKPAKPAAKK